MLCVAVINMTSSFARDMFYRYPEVLVVDMTHKTNRWNYQVLGFVAVDQFGKGQFVQSSFLESNSSAHIACALDHLTRNEEECARVKVILVDKDYKEIDTLRLYFPNAVVLLCKFHATKTFREKLRALGFVGRLRDDAESNLSNLIDCTTQGVYDDQLAMLKSVLVPCCVGKGEISRDGVNAKCNAKGHSMLAYFFDNWDNIQHLWVKKDRLDLVNLDIDTTNYIESQWCMFLSTRNVEFELTSSLY